MKKQVRKLVSLALSILLAFSMTGCASAADGSVSGEIVIYSSMYPFVLEMLDEALKAEFPDLKPGNNGITTDGVTLKIMPRWFEI